MVSHLLHLDCIGTAEVLQAKPADLFGWLHAHGWVFRRGSKGAWRARQEKLDAGLLMHKAMVVTEAGRRVVRPGPAGPCAAGGFQCNARAIHARIHRFPQRHRRKVGGRMNEVIVAGVTTAVISYRGVHVCTTQQLAEFYGCTDKHLSDNFIYQRGRLEEGKHFFKLEGDALRAFKESPENSGSVGLRAASLILWTEKGAARHAKMLTTDAAWGRYSAHERLTLTYLQMLTGAPPCSSFCHDAIGASAGNSGAFFVSK